MMMTRQHYVFIANVLQNLGSYPTKELIVEAFVKVLELDNERFDADRFREASV